jgi:hypothetical protein
MGSCSCVSCRNLVEDRLRQFALFEVEHAIISKQEPSARLRVGRLVVEVFRAVLRIVNFPEHNDRAFLAFAEVRRSHPNWQATCRLPAFCRLAHRPDDANSSIRVSIGAPVPRHLVEKPRHLRWSLATANLTFVNTTSSPSELVTVGRGAISWRSVWSSHIKVKTRPPDHSTISRTRRAIDLESHRAVFTWVQQRLVEETARFRHADVMGQ